MRHSKVGPSRRKRVMFVIGSLDIGGTERHVTQIAPALVSRGYMVSVFCLSHGGALAGELADSGVEVILPLTGLEKFVKWGRVARAGRWIVLGAQLVAAMLARRLALVHCFLPAGNIAGAYAARLAFVPVVITTRRSLNLYQRKEPFLSRIERIGYNLADAIVANSKAAATELTGVEHVPASRVPVIFNGLDLDTFNPAISREEARRILCLDSDSIVFLISANLKAYKAHIILIEALRQCTRELPSWVLLVAGRDDGEGDTIGNLSSKAGFTNRVRLLGPRHDVPLLLRAADVGVLSSREEGFPNAIIEYMAAGLPVVTTAAGGAVEAVVDGETGFIVPVDDSTALGEKLVRLATDRTLRLRMGQAGQARAAKLFSLKACVDSYVALYEELGIA